MVLTFDMSGSWGCGAFTSTGQWFQLVFPDSWQEVHITMKELLPIILAAAIWGPLWRGFTVSCRCDNSAVVAIVNSGWSRMDRAMHLMRCLLFFLAQWDMMFVYSHIPGTDDCAADALSRNSLSSFQSLESEAEADPTPTYSSAWCTIPRTGQGGLCGPIQIYFMMGLAESTHKLYATGVHRFTRVCTAAGLTVVPASEGALCHFAATLAEEGLCIKSYMAGVRHLHISEGYGDPFTHDLHRLHYVLRGIKRAEGIAGMAKWERRPITPDLLRKNKSVWDPKAEEANVVMLWAACCLAYFGFMQIGDLTVSSDDAYDSASHLSWGDIAVDDPACMEVRVKASKTDPFQQGISLFIGKVASDLSAMLAYLVMRGNQTGPLFKFRDGRPLTRQRFIMAVRWRLGNIQATASTLEHHYCCSQGPGGLHSTNFGPVEESGIPGVH